MLVWKLLFKIEQSFIHGINKNSKAAVQEVFCYRKIPVQGVFFNKVAGLLRTPLFTPPVADSKNYY